MAGALARAGPQVRHIKFRCRRGRRLRARAPAPLLDGTLDLRKTVDAVADGLHRDLIALEQRKEQFAVTRILGILQVLAALDLSVGVSQDRGRQRIVVVAIAVAHVAAKQNRGMIEHSAVGFFGGLDLLDEPGKHFSCGSSESCTSLSIFSGLLP